LSESDVDKKDNAEKEAVTVVDVVDNVVDATVLMLSFFVVVL
jgi:hypothetical protein